MTSSPQSPCKRILRFQGWQGDASKQGGASKARAGGDRLLLHDEMWSPLGCIVTASKHPHLGNAHQRQTANTRKEAQCPALSLVCSLALSQLPGSLPSSAFLNVSSWEGLSLNTVPVEASEASQIWGPFFML